MAIIYGRKPVGKKWPLTMKKSKKSWPLIKKKMDLKKSWPLHINKTKNHCH